MEERGPGESVRMAELLAALSLGIDLGFAQPMDHVLRQCRIALRIAELAGLPDEARAGIYYAALLVNVGCHSDSHEQARWFGDDLAMRATKYEHEPFSAADMMAMLRLLGSGSTPVHRVRVAFDFAVSGRKGVDDMIAGHARIARALGEQIGLPRVALEGLGSSYERWDGKGYPGDLAGEDIPIASRVVQLAEFLEVAHRTGGIPAALDVADRRSGKQFDPALVAIVRDDAEKVFHGLDEVDAWDAVIDSEPSLTMVLSTADCDAALESIGRFIDLKSPWTLGHTSAATKLADAAGGLLGLGDDDAALLHRSGLVAGFGRLGVSNAIWDKAGSLSAAAWEHVRLHPQLTQRMLRQSDALGPAGHVAGQLRERLDGSGYPAGLSGGALGRPARILAVADAYQAMREPRPYRSAVAEADAAAALREDVRAGRLDAAVVDAVLSAAGQRVGRRREGPAGLTAREVEVLQLVARGLSNKDIAARLVISAKTVGNHIEHVYTKIGATNRAGASLFAMEHGLLPEEAG